MTDSSDLNTQPDSPRGACERHVAEFQSNAETSQSDWSNTTWNYRNGITTALSDRLPPVPCGLV